MILQWAMTLSVLQIDVLCITIETVPLFVNKQNAKRNVYDGFSTMKFAFFSLLVVIFILGITCNVEDQTQPPLAVQEEAKLHDARIKRQDLNEADEDGNQDEADDCDPEKQALSQCHNEDDEEEEEFENEEEKEKHERKFHHHYVSKWHVGKRRVVERKSGKRPMGRTVDNGALQPEKGALGKVAGSAGASKGGPPDPASAATGNSTASTKTSTRKPMTILGGRNKTNSNSIFGNIGRSNGNNSPKTTTTLPTTTTKAPPKTASSNKNVAKGLPSHNNRAKPTSHVEEEPIDFKDVDEDELFTYVEPKILGKDASCSDITKDSNWEDQILIRSCHYITHDHPRQQYRPRWGPSKADRLNKAKFKHLALFNIRHDLDFQEAGDRCSVRLQNEFMHLGGEAGQPPSPISLEVMSFNRVWYKRLCSFFSYLECIPSNQVRQIVKQTAVANQSYDVPLHFNDSGKDTTGLLRLKIGGRGPGKARHKSGPGGGRLDPRAFQGLAAMQEEVDYPLDGVCVCSTRDPKYPNRMVSGYGMDFVEDEARPRWCVAAPGNLCGRVYFRRALWPGQQHYEFSDHIGCPRRYNGEEYECVRWARDPTIKTNRSDFPDALTSTCEKKPEDLELIRETLLAEEKAKRDNKRRRRKMSDAPGFRVDTYSLILLIVVAIYMLLCLSFFFEIATLKSTRLFAMKLKIVFFFVVALLSMITYPANGQSSTKASTKKSPKKSHKHGIFDGSHPGNSSKGRLKFPSKHHHLQPSSNKRTNSDSGALKVAGPPNPRILLKFLRENQKLQPQPPPLQRRHLHSAYKEAAPLPEDAPCSAATKDSAWVDQVKIRPCHYETDTQPRQQARKKWEPQKNSADEENYNLFHHLAIFNIKYDLDFQEAGQPCKYFAPVDLEVMSYNRVWYKKVCSFFSYLECVPRIERRRKHKQRSKKEKHKRRKRDDYLEDDDDDNYEDLDEDDDIFGYGNEDDDDANVNEDDDDANDDDDDSTADDDESFPDPDSGFPDPDDDNGFPDLDDDNNIVADAKNDNNVATDLKTENNVGTVAKIDNNVGHKKVKKPGRKHKSHRLPPMNFQDSGLDTTGLLRLKIGGRGPGKARHKSGPGGGRLDPRAFKGISKIQKDGYKYDGVCVCSYRDPDFPKRLRTDYGMDFVEDEARPRWCVAAPGNLCGRVYFRRNLWPGQMNYEFSDHIGCPKKYKGEEYECVRWAKDTTITTTKTNRTHFPTSQTSTCEKKPKNVELERQTKIHRKKLKAKKRSSLAPTFRKDIILLPLLITVIVKTVAKAKSSQILSMKLISILLVASLVIVIISQCSAKNGHASTTASTKKLRKKSRKKQILDVMSSNANSNSTSPANTTSNTEHNNHDAQSLQHHTVHHSKWAKKNVHHSEKPVHNEIETVIQGRGIFDTIKGKSKSGADPKGRGIFDLMEKKKNDKGADASGRGMLSRAGLSSLIGKKQGPVIKTQTKPKPRGKKGSNNKNEKLSESEEKDPSAPAVLSEDAACELLTSESEWEDQIPIRPCHFKNYTHPRQMLRPKWDLTNENDTEDKEMFHHLALFNIKHDLDFQEAGDECSVELQTQFMFEGVDVTDDDRDNETAFAKLKEPVDIEVLSYNRVWYKRLCSFFSYLECIPKEEVRVRQKQFYATTRKPQGAQDDDFTPLHFNDSGRDTTGLLRLKIGGRGPGKARHKSGPGGGRLDHRAFKGMSEMQKDEIYTLNGICVCSQTDPKYPNRKRPDYGMDFVEDEARPRWCVAAPGNLCGRVFFKRNLWPGQVNFEFSDHIGCPRKYNGEEYECVRWDQDITIQTNRTEFPDSFTSTCEKKPKDPELELHASAIVFLLLVVLLIMVKPPTNGQSSTKASRKLNRQSHKKGILDKSHSIYKTPTVSSKAPSKKEDKEQHAMHQNNSFHPLRLPIRMMKKHRQRISPTLPAKNVGPQGRRLLTSSSQEKANKPGIQGRVPIRPCHYVSHTHPRQQPRKKIVDQHPDPVIGKDFREEFRYLALFNIKHDVDFQEAGDPCSVELQQQFMFGGYLMEDREPINIESMSYNRIWYRRLCSFFSYLECVPKDEVRRKEKKRGKKRRRSKRDDDEEEDDDDEEGEEEDDDESGDVEKQDETNEFLMDNTDDGVEEDDVESNDNGESNRGEGGENVEDGDNPPSAAQQQAKNSGKKKYDGLITYKDSGMDTTGLLRLKIGGRGPGKGRHKKGPGSGRLDARAFKSKSDLPDEGYEYNGVCVCSSYDPKYPKRKRVEYDMDFVEDEARPRWCVAAPGNLCGRVYFKENIWPGQFEYTFSDHIGCPKKYDGEEYECIRWTQDTTIKINRTKFPTSRTSTCERKRKDPELEREIKLQQERARKEKKRGKSSGPIIMINIAIIAPSNAIDSQSTSYPGKSRRTTISDAVRSYLTNDTLSANTKHKNAQGGTQHQSKFAKRKGEPQSTREDDLPAKAKGKKSKSLFDFSNKDVTETSHSNLGILNSNKDKGNKLNQAGRFISKKKSTTPKAARTTVTTTPRQLLRLRHPKQIVLDASCDEVTKDSAWIDQTKIRPCHLVSHQHPRQQLRKKLIEDPTWGDQDRYMFNHLALFNIKHDLDFQEAGDECSVLLQQEFMFEGVTFDEDDPDNCNLPPMIFDGGFTPLHFNDSGLDTTGLIRLKIGGRGPGKARHKSGPGGRLDHRAFQGMSEMQIDERLPRDGICVCSSYDPKYPERLRTDYGMDFVEDEARPRWCVAAPGNLCGRVYFKRGIWPGQRHYEFSDHIGCPKRYNGEAYECVRWAQDTAIKTNRTKFPNSQTSTCEKKLKDPVPEGQSQKEAELTKKHKKKKSDAAVSAYVPYRNI
ncbi:hypothetical protein Ocin01_11816 [Orchesella cincta]|uniref:Uncharacterized protein n=1 Tax=Orchesella cincta TaxID=48709 RepID=A0A1D2MPC4_ORCCI|nr:hypothetical protein Ocin01_11816 [Orchesella cincta]